MNLGADASDWRDFHRALLVRSPHQSLRAPGVHTSHVLSAATHNAHGTSTSRPCSHWRRPWHWNTEGDGRRPWQTERSPDGAGVSIFEVVYFGGGGRPPATTDHFWRRSLMAQVEGVSWLSAVWEVVGRHLVVLVDVVVVGRGEVLHAVLHDHCYSN